MLGLIDMNAITTIWAIAQLVEHLHGMQNSSNPLAPLNYFNDKIRLFRGSLVMK